MHTHCLSLSSSLHSIFGVGEFSNGSVNLLFTSINKIRYKLLQYKLPCSGPPLTSAINDKDPSFSQLQESPVSRAKFKPANVLTESVWIFLTAVLVTHYSGPGAHACDVRDRCSWTYTWRVPKDTSSCRVSLGASAPISWNQGASHKHFCWRAWIEKGTHVSHFRLTGNTHVTVSHAQVFS